MSSVLVRLWTHRWRSVPSRAVRRLVRQRRRPAGAAGAPTAKPSPIRGRPEGRAHGRRPGGVESQGRRSRHAPGFVGSTNSDLAFTGSTQSRATTTAPEIWDITNPTKPVWSRRTTARRRRATCRSTRTCCSCRPRRDTAVSTAARRASRDTVSKDRLRGIRIFDITDIKNPKYIANVQTCRGSHTHTVLEDPKDKENVYIYVSGSAGVRSPTSSRAASRDAEKDPNSSLFRIEIIKVPLAHPERRRS